MLQARSPFRTLAKNRTSAAFGAGLVRTEYSTYLPAFFVAGALCLIAAALVLTVRKPSAQGIGKTAPARA